MELDIYDSKIIYLLGKNARLSINAIAKEIKRSNEFVSFRLARLKEIGFYLGSTTNINYLLLGRHLSMFLLKLKGCSEERQKEIINFLINNPNVITIQKTLGSWDFIIHIGSKNIIELSNIINELITEIRELDKLEHFYIINEFSPGWSIVIPDNEPLPKIPKDKIALTSCFEKVKKNNKFNITEIDLRILRILTKDARKSVIELSNEVGVSYKTVTKRISEMITNGVISGFDTKGTLSKLGISKKTLFIQVANLVEKRTSIDSFINSLRECSKYWTILGRFNLQLNINVKTNDDLEKTLNKIRKFFKDDLLSLESLDIFEQIKRKGFDA